MTHLLALVHKMGHHQYKLRGRTDHRKRWINHVDAADLTHAGYLDILIADDNHKRYVASTRARRDLEQAMSEQVAS